MTLAQDDYIPQPNPIYSFAGEYKGEVSFRTEEGSSLTGEGSVQWSDRIGCQISVRLDARSIGEGFHLAHSADRFFDLHLQAPNGAFTSAEVHVTDMQSSLGPSMSVEFQLQAMAATFEPHVKPPAPAYWTIPLPELRHRFSLG